MPDIALGQRGWGSLPGGGQPQIQPYMGDAIANRFSGSVTSPYSGGAGSLTALLRKRMMAGAMPGGGGDPFQDKYGQPAERLSNLWNRSRIPLERLSGMQQTRQSLLSGSFGPGLQFSQPQGADFGQQDMLKRLLFARGGVDEMRGF